MSIRRSGHTREPIAADLPALHLFPRHDLADDRLSGAEAVPVRPLRAPGGGSPLFDTAATLLRQAAALGPPWDGVPIAIPLPGALDPERLIGQVTAALTASGLAPARLELVIPEAALVEVDGDGLLALAALRDLGVGLCVDGFGAGLASLTLLRRLPLTGLKLARTLVRALPDDREEAAILRAILGTAQAIGLSVIADGVESERQRAFLAQSGCQQGQGALFGAPLLLSALPRGGLLV
jgi:EAL domain-containing protein (putative c-di-GMP-specific phosphodiesterase class I)